MRKKSKHIGRLFMLRSVGDESVDILFIMGDNGKSLSDELVATAIMASFQASRSAGAACMFPHI